MPVDLTFVEAAVARAGRQPDAVIPVLQALQAHYGYLPEEALRRVCERSEITPAAIAGVASFYDMFRLEPSGRHIVRVCRGTACHVAGAERVEDALRRHLRILPGSDTDRDGQFTIESVACLGTCTLAPVVKIGGTSFGHVAVERVPEALREFSELQAEVNALPSTEAIVPGHRPAGAAEIHVGLGSCCMAKGSDRLFQALKETAAVRRGEVQVKRVGCVGMCHRTPMIEVAEAGRGGTFYADLAAAQATALVQRHFKPRGLRQRASQIWTRLLDGLLLDAPAEALRVQRFAMSKRDPNVRAFLDRQVRIATEHFGRLDPLDADDYVARGGFAALAKCLAIESQNAEARPVEESPAGENGSPLTVVSETIIAGIEQSGLRGRGGAGFPTGHKWRVVAEQVATPKYVICNGDEGDPGAFMDRMILESCPFRVIEGMMIAALAVGAAEGIFYIRNEYPLAVKRVRAALAEMEKRGWLQPDAAAADAPAGGAEMRASEPNLMAEALRGFPLRLTVFEGAGAFVCGEETALIASVEGRRGMPVLRPPFPAQEGLRGKPTLINNVETLALVPWIVREGAEKFAALGTAKSKGTKVFALAGNVRRGGLIEIPMGTTIREIVEEIGGGVPAGRKFKAVQIGGPSGGCVPARLADTPVDFESLREIGAIMGSGGLVVLDDTTCMVDIARYFLQFTQDQSCGKCTFCRIGTKRMLDLLERFCAGKANAAHLHELEHLARQVGAGSLCGLGKTAPNPVLTTLRYFRDEYEAHLAGRCPAQKCAALIRYSITDRCTGCTICAQHCPVEAIPMQPYQRHVIDDERCTRCDACRRVCPEQAVEVK